MNYLTLDFETRSDRDIKSVGSYKYIESPAFRPLLLGYAFDEAEVELIDYMAGEPWPTDVLDALLDPSVVKLAWNCPFERSVIAQSTGIYSPPEQWLDIMHVAAQCGLPMSLDAAGTALGLAEDKAKMKEGKQLIRWFCVPTKNGSFRTPEEHPEKWETFKTYCARDVEAERHIFKLLSRWTPPDIERKIWALDARINDKGVLIDIPLAQNAVDFDARYKAELTEQAVAVSGLSNPNSVAQVKAWLQEQEGIEVPSLNKKAVADVVAQLNTEQSKAFMAIRAELSKSSTKKYEAMVRTAGDDNHGRGYFQFYGAARTGRWAGRGVQLQNLPQNHMEDLAEARAIVRSGDYETFRALYDAPSKVLSELIRTALIPEPGQRFIVADYSAIEARVTAWFANEEWRLETFANGGDIYCASASQMFGVPVEKHGQNSHLRQKGKVAELALGYGGGTNAMLAFGADKLGMSDEEIADTVARWRERSPKVCALWKLLEKGAIRCVVTGRSVPIRLPFTTVTFTKEGPFLWMTLPSGRRISYFAAKYEEGTGKFDRGRKVLSYAGKDQKTGRWVRVSTWGGKLVENLVQATSRDALRDAMLALDAQGYDIRAHVHDEVIITESIGGRSVEDVCAIMGAPLSWAPGLPLRADGYETPFYMKD